MEGSREQQEVGTAFNEMTGRVQRMVDAQRDFVADASHQLRTPLTGLRLRLEEAAATTDGPALEQIEGGLAEVDRLSGVVTELLILSEAGAARSPDAATDLLAGARRAVSRWSSADLAVTGESSVVRCTIADLDRILDVLIENAIDYGPPGQRITLVGAPGRLDVVDEGPGPRSGRGGDDLRPLPPRHRRPRVAPPRHRPRTPDRPRVGVPLERQRDPGQPRLAWDAGDDRAPVGGRHDPQRTRCGRYRMTGWRRNLAIGLAAVAGLLVAAALTTAASSLSGQSIGLSSEPLSAGSGLAPTATATATRTARATRTPTPRPRRTVTPRPTATRTAAPTVDDHGGGDDNSGRGRGRGRGRGGGDD